MTQLADKLSMKEKIGYAMGDVASNLFWMVFVFFGMYFYTDVFGLSAAAVGTLFGVTRLVDAVIEPSIGLISDRTRTRWGQFRPYLLWVAVPFGVIGALTFFTPNVAYGSKVIYAWVTYFLVGVVYSLINLPYSSLMGVISADPDERTSVSSIRFIGAYSAGLIVNLVTLKLVTLFGGGKAQAQQQTGFAITMGLYALVAMALFFVTFASTKQRVQPSENQETSLLKDLGDVVTNVPWLILFLLGIFTLSSVSVRGAVIAYYFKYYVGDGQMLFGTKFGVEALTGAFLTLGSVATIIGVPVTAPLAKKVGKKSAYIILMGIAGVLTVAYYYLPPSAVLPMFILQFLVNFFMGPTAALVFAMYTDAADYAEWKTGRRSTGLVMSASSLAQKLGWTMGGIIGGTLLAAFGYVANQKQTNEALHGILLMASWIPAGGALLASIAVLVYPLNDKRMKEIAADLAARRQKA
jgi:GPH family glycoside/pentoside/hexuronide:cation symporter